MINLNIPGSRNSMLLEVRLLKKRAGSKELVILLIMRPSSEPKQKALSNFHYLAYF